jgi:hypothetical protein
MAQGPDRPEEVDEIVAADANVEAAKAGEEGRKRQVKGIKLDVTDKKATVKPSGLRHRRRRDPEDVLRPSHQRHHRGGVS